MFANRWGLFSVFSLTLVQVPESIAYITCITLKFVKTKKKRLNVCVGLQAQVFQLFVDKVCGILVFEGQDYLDRWALFWGRYWLGFFNFRGNKWSVFVSNKIQWEIKVHEKKTSIVNHVIYKFQYDLCDASYLAYTLRYLHQCVTEHTKQSSSIGKHFINQHCIVPKDLTRHFSILKKWMNEFDCLVHEMLLIVENFPQDMSIYYSATTCSLLEEKLINQRCIT